MSRTNCPSHFPACAWKSLATRWYCNRAIKHVWNRRKVYVFIIFVYEFLINFICRNVDVRMSSQHWSNTFKLFLWKYFACWIVRSVNNNQFRFRSDGRLEFVQIKHPFVVFDFERHIFHDTSGHSDLWRIDIKYRFKAYNFIPFIYYCLNNTKVYTSSTSRDRNLIDRIDFASYQWRIVLW